eukprot:6184208-Pleurochrysis_carterae.AAC.2
MLTASLALCFIILYYHRASLASFVLVVLDARWGQRRCVDSNDANVHDFSDGCYCVSSCGLPATALGCVVVYVQSANETGRSIADVLLLN